MTRNRWSGKSKFCWWCKIQNSPCRPNAFYTKASMMCTIERQSLNTIMNIIGLETQMHCITPPMMTWAVWHNQHQWVSTRKVGHYVCCLKSNLHVKVRHVNGRKRLHTLWLLKYCIKAGANLFSLPCELSQRGKICSEMKKKLCWKLQTAVSS